MYLSRGIFRYPSSRAPPISNMMQMSKKGSLEKSNCLFWAFWNIPLELSLLSVVNMLQWSSSKWQMQSRKTGAKSSDWGSRNKRYWKAPPAPFNIMQKEQNSPWENPVYNVKLA